MVQDGWLYGRGAADSKAAVAIFAHIAARLRAQASALHGTVTLLYDADEHTGRFGGAKRYFAGPGAPADVAGVMIGYPGLSKVVVGGRGSSECIQLATVPTAQAVYHHAVLSLLGSG